MREERVEVRPRRLDDGALTLRGELEPGAGTPLLGKLTLFSGVKDLPSRVKCAVLPWATLHAALKGEAEASTE